MTARRTTWSLAAAGVVATLTLAGCGGDDSTTGAGGTASSGSSQSATLALVAYSTPQEAYAEIIKAYQKTADGKNIKFTTSYGSSGDQSRAVVSGLAADVVAFSLEPDMTRLVKEKLVAADWNKDEYKGMVTDSVAVIATRGGNPKNLRTWQDLAKPDIEVITPNPFTSGGARWNVMAAYGAVSKKGADEKAGVDYLNALFRNVPVQDDSARKALQTFSGGKGDAMIAYENEAIFAKQKGQKLDYVVPDDTILIENPVAVTTKSKNPEAAKKFVAFLHTDEAQKIFIENGYRPVKKSLLDAKVFPQPAGLFTIADFGGWDAVTKKFFDPKASIMATVEKSLGVSTEKK